MLKALKEHFTKDIYAMPPPPSAEEIKEINRKFKEDNDRLDNEFRRGLIALGMFLLCAGSTAAMIYVATLPFRG